MLWGSVAFRWRRKGLNRALIGKEKFTGVQKNSVGFKWRFKGLNAKNRNKFSLQMTDRSGIDKRPIN